MTPACQASRIPVLAREVSECSTLRTAGRTSINRSVFKKQKVAGATAHFTFWNRRYVREQFFPLTYRDGEGFRCEPRLSKSPVVTREPRCTTQYPQQQRLLVVNKEL